MGHRPNMLEAAALPSLPYVSHEILLQVNAEEADTATLANTLGREPSLAARIVSTANSAFYTGQGSISGLDEAVMRLGLNRLRVLATSILLRNQFDASRCPGFQPARYWQHAIATAGASGRLAQAAALNPAPAQLAGLLHSIGVLLLAHSFPRELEEVFAARNNQPDAGLAALVRGQLDVDHHQAGAMLLREWELPVTVCALVEAMGTPGADREPGLLGLLRNAANWADTGFDEPVPPPLQERGLDAPALARVASACRREHEETVALAGLLAD